MSSSAARLKTARGVAEPRDNVVAFFVCPGAKEVLISHTLFTHGDGCSEMEACPCRDVCQWFASHDLGGEIEFSDVAPGAQLKADFTTTPFACPHFRLIEEPTARESR